MKALVTIHTIVDIPNPLFVEGCSESQADNDLLNNLEQNLDDVHNNAEWAVHHAIQSGNFDYDIEEVNFEHCL